MVVEVLQRTELELRAWMTSWYEVLVWLCLAWCGCVGPSVVVWLWCVPSPLLIGSGVGVRDYLVADWSPRLFSSGLESAIIW